VPKQTQRSLSANARRRPKPAGRGPRARLDPLACKQIATAYVASIVGAARRDSEDRSKELATWWSVAINKEQELFAAETGEALPLSVDNAKCASRFAGWSAAESEAGDYTLSAIHRQTLARNAMQCRGRHAGGRVEGSRRAGRPPKDTSKAEQELLAAWQKFQKNYDGDGHPRKKDFARTLPSVAGRRTEEGREKEISRLVNSLNAIMTRRNRKRREAAAAPRTK
jgi:hypothetical protein